MTIEIAVELLRLVIMQSLTLIAPILGTAIAVGVVVSLFQTITSINDQTLTFVPKLVIVGFVMIGSAPWMIRSIMEFTGSIISRMPQMAP